MPNVLIQAPRGQMPVYFAVPPDPGPAPGVVVLHDVFGMSQEPPRSAELGYAPARRLKLNRGGDAHGEAGSPAIETHE